MIAPIISPVSPNVLKIENQKYFSISLLACIIVKKAEFQKTFDKLFFSAILAIPIVIYSLGFIGSSIPEDSNEQKSTEINSTFSNEDLIKETVKTIKNEMVFPSQLDDVTQLVDITAQTSAIRYHYILTEVNTENLSNSYLKEYLSTSICQDNDIKSFLNQGINMEFSYIVEDSTEKYFIILNKEDCSK